MRGIIICIHLLLTDRCGKGNCGFLAEEPFGYFIGIEVNCFYAIGYF